MATKGQENRCILLFVRAPQAGRVKTRLAGMLDPDVVLNIYKNFVADILETLQRGKHRIIICYYPQAARTQVSQWLGDQYVYLAQTGNGLGDKMANAFKVAFEEGFKQAVLIGTDFPDLPAEIIEAAFNSLKSAGAVIGPTYDGGYYLAGFTADGFLPGIFDDMPWSTAEVLSRTLQVFEMADMKCHLLPRWRDIDKYEDLVDFMKSLKGPKKVARHTAAYLARIGMMPAQSISGQKAD